MAGVPTERVRAITRALPNASIRDCSNLVRLIRTVKTPQEVALLARSAEIAEKASVSALEMAGSGVEMQQLVHQFQLVVASEGAEPDHFAFSPYGMGISISPDYKLKGDEIMYFDFGCKFAHYFSDSGTTLALTALPDSLEKRYAALQACMEAGSIKLAPGIRASEVQRAMALECEERNVLACFPHGHGLGLEVRDYPILVPSTGLPIRDDCLNTSSDLPLEEGMVTNLEACVFVSGVGSVHVERSFVVTATGNRPLAQQARDKPHRNTSPT
jgi:Xaa-Pro aminopeptidase